MEWCCVRIGAVNDDICLFGKPGGEVEDMLELIVAC
jgi:hypothetical protein